MVMPFPLLDDLTESPVMISGHLAGELQMSDAIDVYVAWEPETERKDLHVNDVGQLETTLVQLDQQFREVGEPTLVILSSPAYKDVSLGIGLGGDVSILSWVTGGDQSEDLYSLGKPEAEGDLTFKYSTSYSEFPRSAAIELDQALRTAIEFAVTGERPTSLPWQQV
jgi:hypothetical protein